MWLLPAQFGVCVVWFNSQKKIPLIRQQECCPARSAPGPSLMSLVVSGGVLGPLSRPAVDWRRCCGHDPLVPSWQTSHLGTRFQHLRLCGAPTCACGGPHRTPDEGLLHVGSQVASWTEMTVLLLFSCSFMSDSLQPSGLQPMRFPCPSLSTRVYSNSSPLSQ